MSTQEPKSHLAGRIQAALAEDERTNALDITVSIAGGKVFLLGIVNSTELRDAVGEVVKEVVKGQITVVNEVSLATISESTTEETLH